MFSFSSTVLFSTGEPLPSSSVGFGEFMLRVGLGMAFLAVFVTICCIAWRTLPALKELIPGFFAQEEEKPANRSQVLIQLKPVKSSTTTPISLTRTADPTNASAQSVSTDEIEVKAS